MEARRAARRVEGDSKAENSSSDEVGVVGRPLEFERGLELDDPSDGVGDSKPSRFDDEDVGAGGWGKLSERPVPSSLNVR